MTLLQILLACRAPRHDDGSRRWRGEFIKSNKAWCWTGKTPAEFWDI